MRGSVFALAACFGALALSPPGALTAPIKLPLQEFTCGDDQVPDIAGIA